MAGDHRAVLDFVREVRPPFSPEAVVPEFAAVLKTFSLTTAASDRYAGSWPTEAFRKHNITVEPSSRTKSEIYQAWLPMVCLLRASCSIMRDCSSRWAASSDGPHAAAKTQSITPPGCTTTS